MRSLMIIGLAVLCLLQLTSAHPRRGAGGAGADGRRTGGKGGHGRRPFGGQGRHGPSIQACALNNEADTVESMACKKGECNGESLTVTIGDASRTLVFCNHTRPDAGADEGTDPDVEEGTNEGVIAERLRLLVKATEEQLMLRFLLRSACKVNDEVNDKVKKPCDDCSLGPVEVTVNATSYTAFYCNKPSANETTEWLKVFNAGCKRPSGGKHSSSEESQDDEDDEDDVGPAPAPASPFQRASRRYRQRRSPHRSNPGACEIQAADGTSLDTKPCKGQSQCNQGPIEGVDADGTAIKVFFCEKKESSSESEEEVEPLYKKLLCSACKVVNGTDLVTRNCSDETHECGVETFSFNDEVGNEITATYCSPIATDPPAPFFLIDAFRCQKGGRKHGSSEGSSSEEEEEEEEDAPRLGAQRPGAPQRGRGGKASRGRRRGRN